MRVACFGLVLACVATSLAETNAENVDLLTNRAPPNDLDVAKANNEAMRANLEALDLKTSKAKAADLTKQRARDESGPKSLVLGEAGYGEGAAYGGGYGSKKNAATTEKTDAGALARQTSPSSSNTEPKQYREKSHLD